MLSLSLRRLARRLVTTHFEVPLYATGILLILLLPLAVGPGCGHTVDQNVLPEGAVASAPQAQVPTEYPVQLHVQKVVIYDREEVKNAKGEDRVDMSVLIEGYLDARVGFTVVGMIDTILPINPRVGQWSMMPHRDVYSAAPFWWYVSVIRDRQFGTIPLHTVCTGIWARGVLFLYL
ncbi:MAG: hypothetical protein HN396_15555 [Gemmatimonadales bacterium]|jgi:hypothetical protein|nr:hypothetical protein [Gemmatimonadales bacterium]